MWIHLIFVQDYTNPLHKFKILAQKRIRFAFQVTVDKMAFKLSLTKSAFKLIIEEKSSNQSYISCEEKNESWEPIIRIHGQS